MKNLLRFPGSLVLRLILGTACLFLPSTGNSAAAQLASDERSAEKLEVWLAQRQLDRLSVRLVELQLSRELDAGRRNQLARQLAERYRVRYLSNPSDAANDRFVFKAETLIQNFPGIKNSGLELAIAHALYLEAEGEFLKWWRAGAEPAQRDAVLAGFQGVQDRLQQLIDFDNLLQEKVIAVFPTGDNETIRRQEHLNQLESRLLHANYLRGWASYFSAIVPDRNNSSELNQARAAFYRTLRIEGEESIEKIDRKWFDFSAPLSRHSLLGLAIVYAAQRKTGSSRFCLAEAEKLEHAEGGMEIWQFNGLAWSKQWNAAIELARGLESKQPVPTTPFWQAVTEAGFASARFDEQAAMALQRLGLLGLLRQFDATRLKQLVEAKKIELAPDRFEDLWIKGLLIFESGETDKQRLSEARTMFQSALRIVDGGQNPPDEAKVRYLLALVEFKLGNPRESIALLNQTPEVPPTVDVEFVENAAWLKVRGYIALIQTDSLQTGEALAALDDFITQFPESRFARQAEFEQLKLSCALIPAGEAVKRLAAVREHSQYYQETQFELVRTQHRSWSEYSAEPSVKEQQEYDSLVAMDQRFRTVPGISPEQQLASLMLVIDAALKRESTEQSIDKLLALAERINSNPSSGKPEVQSSIVYFRFLAEKKFNDEQAASDLAHWISAHAEERSHRLAALMWLAQTADKSATTETDGLITIYEQLAELLGETSQALAKSRNARATAARLTELYVETGQLEKAGRLNHLLMELMPQQEQFILNAARIHSRNENFLDALPFWRTLAQASATDSPIWLESKLGIVRSLMQTDPAAASKVYRQTISLIDPIPEQWQRVVDELGIALAQTPPQDQFVPGPAEQRFP